MKILFVATVVKTHILEFHIPYLKMLKAMGWETAVAARNDFEDPADCVIPYCDKYFDIPFVRNPFKPGNQKAYKALKKIIDEGGYDIVHCHTPVGAVIGRWAARLARKKGTKVFYTAHGFHFYKGAPLLNWLLYYPVEKFLARKTDVIVTITREDYKRAQKFKAGKVAYTPGVGVDTGRFSIADESRGLDFKVSLGIPADAKVLLSVGEFTPNKNHKLVLQTLPSIPDVYYVLCGRGELMEQLKSMAVALGVSDRTIFTGYRTDVEEFYNMADIFVFPSFREGLPVALMEAMASSLVCVASHNRGTNDLMPESNLLFSPKSVIELKDKLNMALTEDMSAEVENNKKHLKDFDINNTLSIMRSLYEEAALEKTGVSS